MIINGESIESDNSLPVINPYNGEVVDNIPLAGSDQIRTAIDTAKSYDQSLTGWERYEILTNFCQLLKKNKDDFKELISRESGKPIRESEIEVNRSYQTFLISAEEAKRINGEVLPVDAIEGLPEASAHTQRVPLGVIGAITPFNYPLNLVAHKIGPAIASNNAVVLKPSEEVPLTAFRTAELLFEAGLPPSMLQVLVAEEELVSREIVENPEIQKISFTGSVETGKTISEKSGMKSLSLELGGNDPLIVLEDADIDRAVEVAVPGAFGNNGQRCTSIKRILLHNRIADDFIAEFVERTKRLNTGNPLDKETDIGPLIHEEAARKVENKIIDAVENGAELLLGNKRDGTLVHPTILDHVTPEMKLVQEETFGPVAPVLRIDSLKEALQIANGTKYGLQAGVFTDSIEKAKKAASKLEVGTVMINRGPGFRAEHLPFGGTKSSGLGREGIKYAIQEMTEIKTLVI